MTDNGHREIARFYDSVYHRDSGTIESPSRHLVKLGERLGKVAGQKALDVACGTGAWLQVLSQNGATVSGIDISERAIESARCRVPKGDFRVGVAEALPFDTNVFDIVTCLGSLEHFIDQPGALREMVRVAKPDATFLILVPNAGFLTYRLGLYRGTQQKLVRETIRSLAEWNQMLTEAGIEVVDRWRDLHVLDRRWLFRAPPYLVPFRLFQALALAVWPLNWQYQVYHLCRLARSHTAS